MTSEQVEMRSIKLGHRQHVASETWALLSLALSSVLTLLWIALFAWTNARGVGLF
jgi:hypothetical protein